MQAVYYDFATAQRRVDVLKRSGIWPGSGGHNDGTYTLTFDPEVTR